jgi:flagellar biosynthesis protein FlhG
LYKIIKENSLFTKFLEKKRMKHTEVIGIASGKGGAGKTTVAVNLALALQESGYRVMLFDADLGLANAPILLGCHCPFNLSHFLRGEKTLAEIVVTTPQGLRLIPGASGNQQLAALSAVDALKVVQAFSDLEEALDYLIVDMAAGISPAVLNFMAASHRRLIVTRNDPSSIADAYGTIKVLTEDYGLDEIYLVPNAMQSQLDGQLLFHKINRVCAQFLPRTVHYVGTIEQDRRVEEAHQRLEPLMTYARSSRAAKDFGLLAHAVTELTPLQEMSGAVQFFNDRQMRPVRATVLH